jgi:hypothetical protein
MADGHGDKPTTTIITPKKACGSVPARQAPIIFIEFTPHERLLISIKSANFNRQIEDQQNIGTGAMTEAFD